MEQQLFDHHALQIKRRNLGTGFSPWLFDEVACRVVERLQDIRRSFTHVLDLTPFHTGGLAPFLQDLYPKATLVQSPKDDAITQETLATHEPASFDLMVGALGGHFWDNLPQLLHALRTLLQPDGFFMMALWGGDTLTELRQSLYKADLEQLGGVFPRVIPMMTLEDGALLMRQAGFALPVVDQEKWTLLYPGLSALMGHLRNMAETNVLQARARGMTPKGVFDSAQRYYTQDYGNEAGLPATFQLLVLTGWAPAPSQSKPLKPGSAARSLKEVL